VTKLKKLSISAFNDKISNGLRNLVVEDASILDIDCRILHKPSTLGLSVKQPRIWWDSEQIRVIALPIKSFFRKASREAPILEIKEERFF
jgi:hypothetical protein